MCECGCSTSPNYQWKLLGADGFVYLFAVYPSCADCCAPAGVDIARIKPDSQDLGDDPMSFPDLPVHPEYNIGGIPVIDIEVMRRQVKIAIEGTEITDTHGIIDEDWADTLAEEAVPDLRDVVWQTQEKIKRQLSRQPAPTPQPGPISDSASGGASDSGGVDLSGAKKGDWAMSRKYGPCQLEVSLGSETTWAYPLLWKLSEDVKFSTNLRGRMVSDGIDNPYDIIRLLPENGGGT